MSDLAITNQVESRALSADVDALTELANRLMIFPPGKKLEKHEAAQLAAYSYILDADPYNDELHVTNTGIQKGIPLYRRKAKEYNLAKHGKEYGYTASYRPAKPSEADFDPAAGDIAYICTVVDEYQLERWQNKYSVFLKDAIAAGADYKEAKQDANYICGPRPEHTGIGVVDHRESFSKEEYAYDPKTKKNTATGKNKPEMYDRHQRAQKRGLKNGLKDAYPSMMAAHSMISEAEEISRIVSIIETNVGQKMLERAKVNDKAEHNATLTSMGLPAEYLEEDPKIIEAEVVEEPVKGNIEVEARFGEQVSTGIIEAKVGFTHLLSVNKALERSKILSPAMDQKWYNMWANFYTQSRKKNNDEISSANQADEYIANLLSEQE